MEMILYLVKYISNINFLNYALMNVFKHTCTTLLLLFLPSILELTLNQNPLDTNFKSLPEEPYLDSF